MSQILARLGRIALLITALTSLSCDSTVTTEDQRFEQQFHRKWHWIETEGGFVHREFTPQSTGEEFVFDFLRMDSVQVHRNDSLVYSGKLALVKDTDISPTEYWQLTFDFDDTAIANISPAIMELICRAKLQSDTLVLFPYCSDCYISRFVR